MTQVPVYVTSSEYFETLNLHSFSMGERGLIFTAAVFAHQTLATVYRRDFRKAIDHSLAVAQAANNYHMSAAALAVALDHDIKEDGKIIHEDIDRPVTDEDIRFHFGIEYGDMMVFRIDALTVHPGKTREEYYQWFIGAVKIDYELFFLRLFDREHFHRYPFNGSTDKERAKCSDSLGPFANMCQECLPLMPVNRLNDATHLVNKIMELAKRTLDDLDHPNRKVYAT